MNSILRLRKMAGIDTPTFYEYVKRGSVVTGKEIDLTEDQWNAIETEYKGMFEGKKYVLTLEAGVLAILPIKTAFIGGIDNTVKQIPVNLDTETVKDETAAVGGDPEKTADAVLDTVKEPEASAATPDPKDELGAETIKDGDLQDKKTEPEKVKESAEQKARKLIDIIKAGKRATDSAETQVDSNTKVGEPKDELGTASVKDCDLQDHQTEPKKVSESAEEVAKRIIASVSSGNHPHDAENSGDDKAEKAVSTDYSKQLTNGTAVENARANNPKEVEVVQDKTADNVRHATKVEVPAKVTSQINQRLSELKAAKEEYDTKGFNDTSVKQNAIEFLEKVQGHLSDGTLEGLSHAQVLFTTLMSPITDLLPAALINFLATARNSEKLTGTKPQTV